MDQADGARLSLFLGADSKLAWTHAKRAMRFAAMTNDGDKEEGAFFLDRLPTQAEAETISRYLGIPKKRAMSDEELARLRSMAAEHHFSAPATPLRVPTEPKNCPPAIFGGEYASSPQAPISAA